jgi:gas vesicle protein GvpA/GvpJ/GvpM family
MSRDGGPRPLRRAVPAGGRSTVPAHASTRHAPALFDHADATLLDLVDNILTKGVVIDAEVVLGLAGVDLVYVRLSALVSAVDKLRRVLT